MNRYSINVIYDEKSRVAQANYGIFYPAGGASTVNHLLDLEYSYVYDVENRLASASGILNDTDGFVVGYTYDT